MKTIVKLLLVVGLFLNGSFAQAADSVEEAFKESKLYADVRLRYEFVDQHGPAPITENAHSRTARTRVGVKTGELLGLSAVVEGEHVVYLGNDNYNDTVNGRGDHPVVVDPENIQVNQAYGQYKGIPDTTLRGGRQVIAIDNQRFIGHVGWRQNNQVFDAATITNTSIENTNLQYGFIYNVNRIFGEQSLMGDWGSKSHFYNISNTSLPIGKVTTYGYLLDFGSDSAANSSKTFGGSLAGAKDLNDDVKLKYYIEYAYQTDYASNTSEYDANYYHFAPAVVWKGLTTTIGYEILGSDGGRFAFRTPLATGHKFNGWADKFLTTPATGLEDFYIDLTYKVNNLEGTWEILNGLLAKVQYHNFAAEDGVMDYGDEWGVFLEKSINEHVKASVKYANYNADDFATDTQKVTMDIGISF